MTTLINFGQEEKKIIDYIKQARLKKGLTQQQLAELSNISKALIGKAESYNQKYSESAIKKLFKALDLELPKKADIIDKLAIPEIDLFPGSLKENKIEIPISDRFIDNVKDFEALPFKKKGNLIIDKKSLSEEAQSDYQLFGDKYYAVVVNDDSLEPAIHRGNYLVVKYRNNPKILKVMTGEFVRILILKKSNKEIIVKHVRTVNYHEFDKSKQIYYAYSFFMPDKYYEHTFMLAITGDFYFKEGDIELIGDIVFIVASPKIINYYL